jgi:hypothetical protein
MKHKVFLLLISLAFLCAGCPSENTQYISFANKSSNIIGYQFSYGKISELFQDTVFYCNKTSEGFIISGSSFILECPTEELRNLYYIQFLVMDGEKFNQYYKEPCNIVREKVPILHCYRLSLEDLQRMNWIVEYPPNESNE